MNENRSIQITVRPVADRDGKYVAYYESEFLQAQFCVYLKDSIFGALALQAFAEMIRKAFGKNYRSQEIDFQVGAVPVSFENPVLLSIQNLQQHLVLRTGVLSPCRGV